MDHREPSSRLVLWATHSLMIVAFLLWGGLGQLDTPGAPKFFNVFRLQDIIMVITSAFLIFQLIMNNLPRIPFIICIIILTLLIYGILIGIVTENSLANIAFEARLFIYLFVGTLIGLLIYPATINRMIRFYATILSIGIVIQFVLSIFKVNFFVVSGLNPGNEFTLNLPMVRPPGGFHLIAIGLILTIVTWKYKIWKFSILIMMLALIVTQSKTYWGIVPLIMLIDAILINKNISDLLRIVMTGFILIILSSIVLGFASHLIGAGWTLSLPIEKFRIFMTDPEITYGVIGKRVQETQLLVSAWSDSFRSILLGNGWGYLYRNPFLLFYRTDPRDQEILGMFSHNFFLWLLVKIGLIGFLIFLGTLTLSIWSALKGNRDQKRSAIGLVALCFSSIFLGSIENPTGAFLFGLLLSSAARRGREKVFKEKVFNI